MTDAARLANLKASIHELYKARFERCYELTAQHPDRESDDVLSAIFNADDRFRALTLSIETLREQAAEIEGWIVARRTPGEFMQLAAQVAA